MTHHLKALATCVLASAMSAGYAQTTQAHPTATRSKTAAHRTARGTRRTVARNPSLETQIQELRTEMQGQIQTLRQQLSDSNTQLQAAQQAAAAAAASAQQAQAQAQQQAQTLTENTSAVSNLQGAVSDLKTSSTTMATTLETNQAKMQKEIANPDSIHFKGVDISLTNSFLAAESVWRQRATGAGINTPFSGIPFNDQEQAQLSEFYGSGRQSRLAISATGQLPKVKFRGYYELDWLGTGITSNNNQSNSYVMRQRQLWAQAALSNGFTFTGGQMWSLVTEDRVGEDPGTETLPQTVDPQYVAGFNWARQYGLRVVKNFHQNVWLGASIENPETLNVGGRGLPSNYIIGQAGVGGGLYNSTANYSYNLAPDVLAKLAFEPKNLGHYEIYGLARFYRNRVYPNVTTTTVNGVATNVGNATGAYNDSTVGGGVGGSLRVPVFQKRVTVGLKGEWGDGTNRYDDTQFADVTVRPNGQLALLHGYSSLGTLEAHATKRLDVYFNYGIDGTFRRVFTQGGKQSGYGAYTDVETGCNTETIPAAGSAGFVPSSLANCNADNRNIQEFVAGYWYDFYKGPMGRFRQGVQYSYFQKFAWSGAAGGRPPYGSSNDFWTSFRYYLP